MTFRIPIEIVKLEGQGFHPLIEVTAGNDMKLFLLIDTGASQSVFDINLPEKLFDNVETPEENYSVGITAENLEMKTGIIKSLKIGDFLLQNYAVPLMNLNAINNVYQRFTGKRFGGLIGSDFLHIFRCTVDFNKKVLYIRDKKLKANSDS